MSQDLMREIESYLVAAADGSMSRNNSEALAAELLAVVRASQAPAAEQHKPEPIRCPERLKPGGCQLHNLHCGWPACNKEKP